MCVEQDGLASRRHCIRRLRCKRAKCEGQAGKVLGGLWHAKANVGISDEGVLGGEWAVECSAT